MICVSSILFFYDLLFYFSVCCWFCILVSGKKNCMSDWSGWAEMTAWNSYGSLNCFHSHHFLENCDTDLVTLSLALLLLWLHFKRIVFALSLTNLTPMKESVWQTRVLVWNGPSIGQTWQASDFRLLHAFCIVCSMHGEVIGDHFMKAGMFTICHSPFSPGDPADSLPLGSVFLMAVLFSFWNNGSNIRKPRFSYFSLFPDQRKRCLEIDLNFKIEKKNNFDQTTCYLYSYRSYFSFSDRCRYSRQNFYTDKSNVANNFTHVEVKKVVACNTRYVSKISRYWYFSQ